MWGCVVKKVRINDHYGKRKGVGYVCKKCVWYILAGTGLQRAKSNMKMCKKAQNCFTFDWNSSFHLGTAEVKLYYTGGLTKRQKRILGVKNIFILMLTGLNFFIN